MPIASIPAYLLKNISAEMLDSHYASLYSTVPGRWADLFEPERQCVRYDASVPRVVYEERDTFYDLVERGPSDSRWMVPQ